MRKPSRKTLISRADKIFSEYIRKRYADPNGNVICFTCGKRDFWKNMDAGHFQSRKHYATRWNETNVQVQCKGCNVFRYGEQYKFGVNLDAKVGKGTAEMLLTLSRRIMKYTDAELLELIDFYKKKVAEL